ncbi:MAG: right-handed parallel beta-helix repeat-containing protein [Bellilinea sp.]
MDFALPSHVIRNFTQNEFAYVVRSAATSQYIYYQKTKESALGLINAAPSTFKPTAAIQQLSDGSFHVLDTMKIQPAIDLASPNASVNIYTGTFEEQILIEKNLTLSGTGDSTKIQSPTTLISQFATTTTNKPIITVKNADNVTLKNFKVDGLGRGNSNYRFMGVAFYNAGGTVENVTITAVRDTPFSGSQHGVGLYAYNSDGQARYLIVKNSTITDFQKNGITITGTGLTATVIDNAVTGKGPTDTIAQNGIQYSSGVNGTIQGNTVEGIAYTGSNWTASGILTKDVGNVSIYDNEVKNSQTSIYLYGGSATITNNRITTSKAGIGGGNYLTGIAAADPPFLPPAPMDTQSLSEPNNINAGNTTDDVSVMDTGHVVVIQDNILKGGGDDPASVGIGAWAGYTDEDVSFNITNNQVFGWGYGLDISKCNSGCEDGKFTSIILKENKVSQNNVGMYTNIDVDATLNWWGTLSWFGYDSITGIKDLFEVEGDGNIDWQPWRDQNLTLSLDIPTTTYADDDNAGKAEGEAGANGGTFGYDAFATIEDALNHVAPGGTVLVGSGTYSGDIQINKAVTLTGQNRPVLDGRFWVNANDVVIQGFEIQNGRSSHGVDTSGIYISGAQNVTIRDNHLIGTWTGGGTDSAERGILTSGNVADLLVEGNRIEKWVSGLYLNPTSGKITVSNNEIRDNWAGAGTDGLSDVIFKNNYFTGNIEGVGASSVGASFVVEENAFINNTTAMKHYGGGNPIDAERNWWGHQSGPTIPSNTGGSGQPVSSNVDFVPWLCDGSDSQPSAIGFQPAAGAATCTVTSAATRLVFVQYPADGFENLPFAVQPAVRAEDDDGNLAVNFNGVVILYLANNPAGGALQGSLLVNAVNGVAAFSGVSINKAGENYRLAAIATSLAPAVGGFFNVLPQNADLAVSISASPNPVETGADLTYTVSVQNLGPLAASNLTLTVNLPAGVTFVNAGGSGWTCSQSGGVVTCTRFSLAAASSAPNVAISVKAPAQAGSITATASINATSLDLVDGNNQASVNTVVVTIPETGGITIYLPLVKK